MSGEERRESQGRRHGRGDTRAEFCGYKGVRLPGRLGVDSLDPRSSAYRSPEAQTDRCPLWRIAGGLGWDRKCKLGESR